MDYLPKEKLINLKYIQPMELSACLLHSSTALNKYRSRIFTFTSGPQDRRKIIASTRLRATLPVQNESVLQNFSRIKWALLLSDVTFSTEAKDREINEVHVQGNADLLDPDLVRYNSQGIHGSFVSSDLFLSLFSYV